MDWTEADIADQTGRVALVTGANSGIGYEAARALAQKGATVVLGCRNMTKATEAKRLIDATSPMGSTEILELDLGDLESVEAAAGKFVAGHDRLDLLVNNAGLMFTPRGKTAQGFETQMGVNHFGHFALTAHVLAVLRSTDGSRIVNVSSGGHKGGRIKFDDINAEKKYSPLGAYAQSKLANLLFTRELQRRLTAAGSSTVAVSAHPGGSDTNLGNEPPGGAFGVAFKVLGPLLRKLPMQSAAMGALPTLRAATDPTVAGGDYFGPDGKGEMRGHPVRVGMSKRAQDDAVARRLWDVSEQLTGVTCEI